MARSRVAAKAAKRRKFTPVMWDYAITHLCDDGWTFEQSCGRARRDGIPMVCKETLYQEYYRRQDLVRRGGCRRKAFPAAEVSEEAQDAQQGREEAPQRRRAQGPAQGQRVRRHPRRGDEADRPHAQRPSAQVPELAHAPRGVHGAPAPPPPCRGLMPHRSLKWPAREGGFRLAASRRPLRGRLHPSSRAGLAFGSHQAKRCDFLHHQFQSDSERTPRFSFSPGGSRSSLLRLATAQWPPRVRCTCPAPSGGGRSSARSTRRRAPVGPRTSPDAPGRRAAPRR